MLSRYKYAPAVLVVAAAWFLSGCVDANQSHAGARGISVTGQGEAAGPPDKAMISAGVQTLASTVAESSRENQEIVDRIMAALDELGIPEKNVQTANYNIWPEQRHDPRAEGDLVISGYRVSNMVNVKIDDINAVGDVLAAVANAGANSVHGINFAVDDTAELEQRARAAAMADARERAEALAELAGVELGEVLNVSMSAGGGYPMPMGGQRMSMMAESAAVPGVSPGELSVNVSVNVTWAIR